MFAAWLADFAGALFGGALAGAIVGVRLYRQGRRDERDQYAAVPHHSGALWYTVFMTDNQNTPTRRHAPSCTAECCAGKPSPSSMCRWCLTKPATLLVGRMEGDVRGGVHLALCDVCASTTAGPRKPLSSAKPANPVTYAGLMADTFGQ